MRGRGVAADAVAQVVEIRDHGRGWWRAVLEEWRDAWRAVPDADTAGGPSVEALVSGGRHAGEAVHLFTRFLAAEAFLRPDGVVFAGERFEFPMPP